MPIIELRIVAALEACATQAKGLQVVALNPCARLGCHMCAVGNALCRGDFPAQMPASLHVKHGVSLDSLRDGGDLLRLGTSMISGE